jgi:hypothetical protein
MFVQLPPFDQSSFLLAVQSRKLTLEARVMSTNLIRVEHNKWNQVTYKTSWLISYNVNELAVASFLPSPSVISLSPSTPIECLPSLAFYNTKFSRIRAKYRHL